MKRVRQVGRARPQSERMAKAKKTKPRDHLTRWRVSLITATPAKFVEFTLAPDAYDIGDELRHRLMAIRDDL